MATEDAYRILLGKPSWKINPLEAIGLSPAILNLGLSRDDLHEHCRRIARDLLARVHPDRHNGAVNPLVEKFSDAFNLLNDSEVFERALASFRTQYTQLRKENADLRADMRTLQTRIRNQEKEIAFLTERLNKYEKPRRKYAN
jgi:DNA anti-recombination protein RmuC